MLRLIYSNKVDPEFLCRPNSRVFYPFLNALTFSLGVSSNNHNDFHSPKPIAISKLPPYSRSKVLGLYKHETGSVRCGEFSRYYTGHKECGSSQSPYKRVTEPVTSRSDTGVTELRTVRTSLKISVKISPSFSKNFVVRLRIVKWYTITNNSAKVRQ